MIAFSRPRFVRALQNDLLTHAKRMGIATLALTGVALVPVLTNATPQPRNPTLLELIFTIALLAGGALFTSTSWSDMHHPLGRFHYLMLPYSNLERFLGRYLLTGPLFYLYITAVMTVFEPLANAVTQMLFDVSLIPLSLSSPTCVITTLVFFGVHPLVFAGAIYFRNFSLPRTALTLLCCHLLIVLVALLALRIFYWDSFSSLFVADKQVRFGLFDNMSSASGERLAEVLGVVAALWALYLGWLFLNDHEAQDGL